jgi:AcrR family transcriptional regulator
MSSGDPETRERILKETRRLMEAHRGRDVRLEDIAKAAGVSRQAVYMHFGSRSGLLIATARYLDEVLGLEERLSPFRAATEGIQSLNTFVEFWGSYIPDVYGLAKALLTVRETDEAAAAAWNDRMTSVFEGCARVIHCLVLDSMLAPEWTEEEAAEILFALLSIPGWENLTIEQGWTQEQYIQRMKTITKKTLVRTTQR